MSQSRFARALAVLVLILAQVALGLPHRMAMGEAAGARVTAQAGNMPQDCRHDDAPPSRSKAPVPPCGSCPDSMPGSQRGGCMDMASCGPTSAAPSAPLMALAATVSTTEFSPATSSPAAHEFIPDPPPPRA